MRIFPIAEVRDENQKLMNEVTSLQHHKTVLSAAVERSRRGLNQSPVEKSTTSSSPQFFNSGKLQPDQQSNFMSLGSYEAELASNAKLRHTIKLLQQDIDAICAEAERLGRISQSNRLFEYTNEKPPLAPRPPSGLNSPRR